MLSIFWGEVKKKFNTQSNLLLPEIIYKSKVKKKYKAVSMLIYVALNYTKKSLGRENLNLH